MVKQIFKFSAATGVSLVLMGSVASAASTINLTGPGSVNVITNSSSNKKGCKVTSKNKVAVLNANAQKAKTGKAKSNHNTTGGNAVSGTATNANETSGSVEVTNNPVDPCSCNCEVPMDTQGGSITNTGPRSWNMILNGSMGNCGCKGGGTSVYNSNSVLVGNLNMQSAKSGNASSSGNTTGGDATSGNASNTNTTELLVVVSN